MSIHQERVERVQREREQRNVVANQRQRAKLAFLPKVLRYVIERLLHRRNQVKSRVKHWGLRLRNRLKRRKFGNPPDPIGEGVRQTRLQLFLNDPHQKLVFPSPEKPLVSILVLNYNRADELLECLSSILAHTQDVSYELIVADNNSTDQAPELIQRVEGATLQLNKENLGFVHGNNQASALARGEYLLLLNNDTVVSPGWLRYLVGTLQTWPQAGAVGPKMIYPDGRLQEAGAIVYSHGGVDQLGMGGDPLDDTWNHIREVDYCSAACLLLKTELFRGLGGFAACFAPAYYEDLDLCIGISAKGLKVIYQPAAVITHHGPSRKSFTSTANRTEINKQHFVTRRKEQLQQLSLPRGIAERMVMRERRVGKRVLVLDRADSMMPLERSMQGELVTFIPLDEDQKDNPSWHDWRQKGIEILRGGWSRFTATIELRIGGFDEILITQAVDTEALRWQLQTFLPLTEVVTIGEENNARGGIG